MENGGRKRRTVSGRETGGKTRITIVTKIGASGVITAIAAWR
jgi:hypothetical protein